MKKGDIIVSRYYYIKVRNIIMTMKKSTRLLLWLPHGLNNKTYSLVDIHVI